MPRIFPSISKRKIKNNFFLLAVITLTLVSLSLLLRSFLLNAREKNWKFVTNNEIDWYPIRGADYGPFSFDQNNIYISNLDGYTYSLDKDTGKENWRFRTDFYSIYPKATDSTLVFVSDFDGRIYAIDKRTGKEEWRFVTPNFIKADTEPILSEDFLYFGSRNGTFYALDKKTGEKKWEFKTKGIDEKILVVSKPIIHFGTFVVDEKNVYINSSTDNTIYALDKKTGQEQWRFESYQYVNEKPILEATTITFRSNDGYFYTLEKTTGQMKWKWLAKTGAGQSIFVGDNDTVYYVDENKNLYKFNSQTNDVIWNYRSNEFIPDIRERLVVNEERVYLTTITRGVGGQLLVLNNQTGKLDWQFESTALINYKPQLENGLVYLASGGDLYAFKNQFGEEKWRFKGIGTTRYVFVTKEGIYLVNIDDGGDVIVYFIDKEMGKEKWHFGTGDADANTFIEEGDNLYFLAKDRKSIFSLGKHNIKKVLKPNAIHKINSSDVAIQGRSQSFIWKILKPAKKLVEVPLIQITGLFDNKRKVEVVSEERNVNRYDVYELTIKHEDSYYDNPWEETDVSIVFETEDGESYNLKGFYYDKNTWKVRFAPPKPGTWSWKLSFKSPFARTTKKGSLVVQDSSDPGFVRIHPTNPYRFVFDNGELFTAIGIQDCFRDDNHTGNVLDQLGIGYDESPKEGAETINLSDLETYLKIYGPEQAGFNLFRFNVENCSEKLWKEISSEGNYYSINAGIRGDKLVETLRNNNFRIWMSLTSFSLPLEGSIEDRNYQKAVKNYIDYVVARYASDIDIWELANEISLDEEWIRFVAEYLRSIDPYKHPITVNWERPDLPQIEINSVHWYYSERELESDLIIANKIAQAKKWGKPVVFSEVGNTDVNWDENSALRMRLKLWTAFFKEASLIFWNTSAWLFEHENASANIYLGPTERQYTKVFHEFIKDLDANLVEEKVTIEDDGIRGYGMSSDKNMLVYIRNGRSHTEVTTTTINMNVKREGILQWVDPQTGKMIESREVYAGLQSIQTPKFKIDLAMKITFHAE